ncbi:hypothetical protein LSH36_333g03035 [Paralvinella palmiformis]|uniref:Uncharacterized protein n=1 Tax=Paralvinella palmiformis TaxID=53620 RepID=A0AAD9JH51_9ANNE|nr:hypothetical protein LSH36_333g03035 [Paralvinella palmiformis]
MAAAVDKVNVAVASLKHANTLLLCKQFDKCLSVSLEELKIIRRNNEVKSFDNLKEALSVLAIQAYAELDRWQEVLPFVTSIYMTLEEVPANIIQLCILLHASMKDYLTCAALANVWLRNPKNYCPESEDKYLETIDIYVGHVLIPANRWDDMQTFLDNCPGLSPERKDQFFKVIRTLQHQVDQLNVEKIEAAEDDVINSSSRKTKEHNHPLKREDLLSWPTWTKIWLLIVNLWKRMFAPFYQAKSEL